MGRCHVGATPRSRLSRIVGDVGRRDPALPDGHQGADERPDHLVAERRWPGSRSGGGRRRSGTSPPRGRADARATALGELRPTAWGDGRTTAKSCSPTSSGAHARAHGVEVEVARHPPGQVAARTGRARRGSAPCSGSGAIVAEKRASKSSSTIAAGAHHDPVRAEAVQRLLEPLQVDIRTAARRSVTTWPQAWTPRSVRPAQVIVIGAPSTRPTARPRGRRRPSATPSLRANPWNGPPSYATSSRILTTDSGTRPCVGSAEERRRGRPKAEPERSDRGHQERGATDAIED